MPRPGATQTTYCTLTEPKVPHGASVIDRTQTRATDVLPGATLPLTTTAPCSRATHRSASDTISLWCRARGAPVKVTSLQGPFAGRQRHVQELDAFSTQQALRRPSCRGQGIRRPPPCSCIHQCRRRPISKGRPATSRRSRHAAEQDDAHGGAPSSSMKRVEVGEEARMSASAASQYALLPAQALRACGRPILSAADAEGRQTWVAPLAGATHREFTNMATKGVGGRGRQAGRRSAGHGRGRRRAHEDQAHAQAARDGAVIVCTLLGPRRASGDLRLLHVARAACVCVGAPRDKDCKDCEDSRSA